MEYENYEDPSDSVVAIETIKYLKAVVLDVDSAITKADPSLSLDEACEILVSLNRLKADLSVVYSGVEKIVSRLLQAGEHTSSDGSTIEKKTASDRRGWKHKDLASEVASRLSDMAVDMDTGERLMDSRAIAEKMLDYVQPSYWRVKELGKIGINADNFCEVGEEKDSIIVRKAK